MQTDLSDSKDKSQARDKRIQSIEYSIRNAQKEKRDIVWDKLIFLICERYGCSDRTAKEYIKQANMRIANPDLVKKLKDGIDFEKHMELNEPQEEYAKERRKK